MSASICAEHMWKIIRLFYTMHMRSNQHLLNVFVTTSVCKSYVSRIHVIWFYNHSSLINDLWLAYERLWLLCKVRCNARSLIRYSFLKTRNFENWQNRSFWTRIYIYNIHMYTHNTYNTYEADLLESDKIRIWE